MGQVRFQKPTTAQTQTDQAIDDLGVIGEYIAENYDMIYILAVYHSTRDLKR